MLLPFMLSNDVPMSLLDFQEFDRLDVDLVKRLRNEFHLLEIDGLEVDASDAAVPCSPVVESEGVLVGSGSHLSRTWETFWNISPYMLRADWNVKVVQDVEGLNCRVKSGVPYWCCSLEEGSTHKS